MTTRLARAFLFAKDLDKLVRFYKDGLGLSVRSQEPGLVVLDAGPAELALHAIPEHIAKHIVVETPPEVREGTPLKLVFAVDDVEAHRKPVSAAGGALHSARKLGAHTLCDGVDPEGNVFQLSAG